MKRILIFPIAAILAIGSVTAEAKTAESMALGNRPRTSYKYNDPNSAFSSRRQERIDAANALMMKGHADRFSTPFRAKQDTAGNYLPDKVQTAGDAIGIMDGPNGKTWHYDMTVKYNHVVHNEYWTEHLPVSFKVNIYDENLNQVGCVQDTLILKEYEARVRDVQVMEKITKNYFNRDDNYEVAITVLTNPVNYGIIEYTYIYTLGQEPGEDGWSKPIRCLNAMVSDIMDASTETEENIIMTYTTEGNTSGYTDEDLKDPEKYWEYQTKNFLRVTSYGPADENGEQTLLFDQQKTYLQWQGNQQDDPAVMTTIHNGKATIIMPYYKKLFFKPYYSMTDDLVPEDDNSLVIEIWQQPAPGQKFELVQTTEIPVVKADEPDVIWSYYCLGAFDWTNDIAWDGDKSNFIITRRDYIASSDSERKSYFIYNADGSLRKTLFENAESIAIMSDLEGFDHQALFISNDGLDYIFNFMNMRTFDIELALNWGLKFNEEDDPDYIMANIDRTPTADGKSYYYVSEMRLPEYDDINDCNYMRVAWITREGKLERIDKVNMGNKVNYAKLFLGPDALKADFYHSDANHEYMLLIKRAMEGTATEEQLLIGQVVSDEYPLGRDLLFLRPNREYGALNLISAYKDGDQKKLTVLYVKTNAAGEMVQTQTLYNLPLDVDTPSGIENVNVSNDAAVDGPVRYYNLSGFPVDIDAAPAGIYIRVQGAESSKVLKK